MENQAGLVFRVYSGQWPPPVALFLYAERAAMQGGRGHSPGGQLCGKAAQRRDRDGSSVAKGGSVHNTASKGLGCAAGFSPRPKPHQRG